MLKAHAIESKPRVVEVLGRGGHCESGDNAWLATIRDCSNRLAVSAVPGTEQHPDCLEVSPGTLQNDGSDTRGARGSIEISTRAARRHQVSQSVILDHEPWIRGLEQREEVAVTSEQSIASLPCITGNPYRVAE